ncbi:MAG: hypothetical protein HUK24_05315, partial [Sphaerochaetaceae bacterium]|nr:hypothetical protein [Sphaerochaetaceae bacterium]
MFTFVLLGTGWRASFYMRVTKALNKDFSIASVYTRNKERLSFIQKEGFYGTTSLEEALKVPHDGVIVASGPKDLVQTLEYLSNRDENIIVETSFLTLSEEELKKCENI